MRPSDMYANEETTYWFFAHSFGWTPQLVDEQYPDRLNALHVLENEFKKLENEQNKK